MKLKGLCRLKTMICSPGWIHKPCLHHTHSDLPRTNCLLIYNMRSTYTDDDVMYYVSQAERRIECASLADRGDNEGIDGDDIRPKLFAFQQM